MTSVLATIASTAPQSDAAYAAGFLGRLAIAFVFLLVAFKLWLDPWMKFMDGRTDRVIERRGRDGAGALARSLVCGTIVAAAVLTVWLMATRNPFLYGGTKSLVPLVVMFLAVPYYCFLGLLWGKTSDSPWGSE